MEILHRQLSQLSQLTEMTYKWKSFFMNLLHRCHLRRRHRHRHRRRQFYCLSLIIYESVKVHYLLFVR